MEVDDRVVAEKGGDREVKGEGGVLAEQLQSGEKDEPKVVFHTYYAILTIQVQYSLTRKVTPSLHPHRYHHHNSHPHHHQSLQLLLCRYPYQLVHLVVSTPC